MQLDFPKLESLRILCREIQQDQGASLKSFSYGAGFQQVRGSNKFSVSSSATCVLSLVATGNWKASKADTKKLLSQLISKDTSAGLPKDNPFTTAWILEAVTALKEYSEPLDPDDDQRVIEKEGILQEEVRKGEGGVSIAEYPASAYLTQLVVRVLRRRNKLTPELEQMVNESAWAQLTRQLALVHATGKTQDAFALAYLLMLVTAVTPISKIGPAQPSIQRSALKTVFDCQLDDGTWPLSQPLFHYQNFGNVYCYDYEMLTHLLEHPQLESLLIDYLPKLGLAAESLVGSAYHLENGTRAWASGHHPQLQGPESWTTASVYHFVNRLDRILAEAIRRELFRHLVSPLPTPSVRRKKKSDFAKVSLDSRVKVKGKQHSLKKFLWENFVKPLWQECDGIANGRSFSKRTPRSAIFFGPPGTAKTDLSKEIADFLGWPLLAIDPSHLLRNGMDGIQAEANAIFRMLEQAECVVVLFDEFDELVLERGSPKAEAFSRFLTTAMLPKLARLHKQATLVFIIATNNIGDFDLAIRRPGRFDHVVQIMPPTCNEKMTKKNWGAEENVDLEGKLRSLSLDQNKQIRDQLGDLTYLECDAFATELAKVTSQQEAIGVLDDQWKHCILQTMNQDDKKNWKDRCKEEEHFNR